MTYGAPMRLAHTAISAARGADAKGGEYFDTRGELVMVGGRSRAEITLRFREPDEAALALILGARIDANGVFVEGIREGTRNERPLARPISSDSIPERPLPLARPISDDSIPERPLPLARPISDDSIPERPLPLFALGYEAFAVEGTAETDMERAARLADEGHGSAGAYEKTWFYKCRARMGQYARAGASAAPKAAHIELIITVLATRRLFAGAPLTAAYLPPDAATGAGDAWFDEVYMPEERIWTS